MTQIIHTLNSFSQLSPEADSDLLSCLKNKTYQKGGMILNRDSICRYIYFIDSGLVKLFFFNGDREFIMTFFRENMLFTEINSFVTQQSSKYMLLALEDTVVQCIHRDSLEELCKKHHCIETLFRRMYALASMNMMKRISEILEENASNRYNNFIQVNADILQRISLGDLANYLGITQVSLSRIRTHK